MSFPDGTEVVLPGNNSGNTATVTNDGSSSQVFGAADWQVDNDDGNTAIVANSGDNSITQALVGLLGENNDGNIATATGTSATETCFGGIAVVRYCARRT